MKILTEKENILITGSTGAGISYMASAIGNQESSMGYKVINTTKLFTMLKTSKADGPYVKQINRLEKQELIILDDFGLKELDNINRHSYGDHRGQRQEKINYNRSSIPVEHGTRSLENRPLQASF